MQQFKNMAIFGMGVSGQAASQLAADLNCFERVFYIDRRPGEGILSESAAESILPELDLIVLSPGIAADGSLLRQARERGITIFSEIEFGYRALRQHSNAPIVAITGTNGKTTTVKMLEMALQMSGLKVSVAGNIGTPFSAVALRDEVELVLLELSSFQLETIQNFRPQLAALLNLSPAHQERYTSFADYRAAKLNILKNMQGDDQFFFFAQEQCYVGSAATVAHLVSAQSQHDLSQFKLPGEHNRKNLLMVQQILISLENRKCIADHSICFEKVINDFRGVEHRLELVASKKAYDIYNDSKSTNFAATLAALRVFSDGPDVYLIFGGQRRDDVLCDSIELSNLAKKIFVIGEVHQDYSGEKFIAAAELAQVKEYLGNEDFSGVLLFSPGYPSFDQFENYQKRGEKFKQLFSDLF